MNERAKTKNVQCLTIATLFYKHIASFYHKLKDIGMGLVGTGEWKHKNRWRDPGWMRKMGQRQVQLLPPGAALHAWVTPHQHSFLKCLVSDKQCELAYTAMLIHLYFWRYSLGSSTAFLRPPVHLRGSRIIPVGDDITM